MKNYLKKLDVKLRLNSLAIYISRLGILDRSTYKTRLKQIYKKYSFFSENLSDNYFAINDYGEYVKVFNYDLNIREDWEKNIQLKVNVNLIDVLMGKTVKVFYQQIIKCSECSSVKRYVEDKCTVCQGTGHKRKENNNCLCHSCKGYGYHSTTKCSTCHNNLIYKKRNSVDLKFDNDFYDGCVLSFTSLGNYDIFKNNYGTLKITPVIVSDVIYDKDRRVDLKVSKGSQVESQEKVKLSTMVLGGTLEVNHALGKCNLIIEPSTQPGDYKIINNIGIPNYYDNEEEEMHRGGQIVFFELDLPDKKFINENPKIKRLFEELAKYDDVEELKKLNRCNLNF
jgi:molecular chaperone DnaJ